MTETGAAAYQALFERRSIRRYTDEAVSREDVRRVLDAGRWAPSGLNNQPWKFLVLMRGDPRIQPLAGCTKDGRIVRAAAALVAVFLDRERSYHEVKDQQSAGACIQNMLLAAHALGFGGVWLGEILNQADQVFEVLGLDRTRYEFMAVVALGKPAEQGGSSRRSLDELLLEAF